MGEYTGVYSQFAMHFSTLEEAEAYKRKLVEELGNSQLKQTLSLSENQSRLP